MRRIERGRAQGATGRAAIFAMACVTMAFPVACKKEAPAPETKDAAESSNKKEPREPETGVQGFSPTPLPPLDMEVARRATAALEEVAPEQRGLLAAKALSELERARLGPEFAEGLDALTTVAPDQRALVSAKIIEKHMDRLDLVCEADAAQTMRSLALISPDDHHAAVWAACDFGRHGLVTEEESRGADPIGSMVAHMAYGYLATHGPVTPEEKALLRALALSPDVPQPSRGGR